MGIGVSIFLIAVGAVLAFAVHATSGAVNIHTVGWILMGVGLVGLLLALLWWERWGPGYLGWHRGPYEGPPGDGPYRRGYGRRRMVVEDEAAGPPRGPDPYDAPPPP